MYNQENDIRGNVEAGHISIASVYQPQPQAIQNTPIDVVCGVS